MKTWVESKSQSSNHEPKFRLHRQMLHSQVVWQPDTNFTLPSQKLMPLAMYKYSMKQTGTNSKLYHVGNKLNFSWNELANTYHINIS